MPGTSRAKNCIGTTKNYEPSKTSNFGCKSSKRLGGWVRTDRIDGHILERGPRGFRPKGNGVETLKLIESLGLQGATIAPSMKSSNRFVYSENELQKLPSSLVNIFLKPPPVMKGVVRTLATEVLRPKNKTEKRREYLRLCVSSPLQRYRQQPRRRHDFRNIFWRYKEAVCPLLFTTKQVVGIRASTRLYRQRNGNATIPN